MRCIDLTEDASCRVIVDREDGQYLGHPTTCVLRDGHTMLCVYPKGHGKGAIIYKRSEDEGRTWSARLPVPESFSTSLECPTLYRVTDTTLLLFSGMYPARMAKSSDEGRTWSELEPVGDFGGIVFVSSVYRRKNGQLMAFFHDDGRTLRNAGIETVFTVYAIVSDDDGNTWSEPIALLSREDADLCEPCVIASPDGDRLVMLLRENSRTKHSFVCESLDDGATWHGLRELPWTLTGDRHTAKYLPGGELFVSFRDMAVESPWKGDWVAWVGRFEDILAGNAGSARYHLMRNHFEWADCAYPGVEVFEDGTVVTTTYGHWDEGKEPYVVAIRIAV